MNEAGAALHAAERAAWALVSGKTPGTRGHDLHAWQAWMAAADKAARYGLAHPDDRKSEE